MQTKCGQLFIRGRGGKKSELNLCFAREKEKAREKQERGS